MKRPEFVVSENLENHLKLMEGFRPTTYKCPAGKSTIGYGHLIQRNETNLIHANLSKEDAREMLILDVLAIENKIRIFLKIQLTENEMDAIISLSFNIGIEQFRKSTLLKLLNDGNKTAASKEFARWNKSGSTVLDGLVKRRKIEQNIFLFGLYEE